MFFRPRLSFACVLKPITVSARPVRGVSVSVGGTRSLSGSIDVLSLQATITKDTDAATAATTKPRRRTPNGALYMRVTFNGWLVAATTSLAAARHHQRCEELRESGDHAFRPGCASRRRVCRSAAGRRAAGYPTWTAWSG